MTTIRFVDQGVETTAEVGESILQAARKVHAPEGDACGGVCACSTCHVRVQQGVKSCPPATEDEEDMLDEAPDVSTDSRLACKCVPDGTQDLIVLIPNGNRQLGNGGA